MDEHQEKDTIKYHVNKLAELYRDRTAILWKGSYRTQSLSYFDIHNKTRRFVSLLHSMGIKKGDKVCLWAYNSPSWVVSLFGCLVSGIVVVPVDFNSRAEFVKVIINRVGAKALLLSRLKDVDAAIPKLYVENLLEKLEALQPVSLSDLPHIESDALVEIIFTSGTTSEPKGVLITNRNLVSNIRSLRHMMSLDPSYMFLSILPLSHLLEQVLGLFYPLRFGAVVVFTSTKKSSAIKKLLKKHKITTLVCVPFFLDSLMDSIVRRVQRRDKHFGLKLLMSISAKLTFRARRMLCFSLRREIGAHLRFFICGGAKLNEATEDFWNALGIRVLQGYGLTEASPVVSCNTIRQYKPHTVGRSLPGQELRIKDDGEILIRGRNVTPEYYKDDEATRVAFEGEWYRTGDIGEVDSDGFLVIKGRKKDMILTSSGLNVFPQDIEMALNELPSVKESCVVGLEENGRTKIHATVILETSCTETIEQMMEKANEKLNASQRIHEGSIWPDKDFPRTFSLKIKKHEVIRALKECKVGVGKEEPLAESAAGEESDLLEILTTLLQVPRRSFGNDSKLADDLGLDSLGLVELVVMLEERFNIDFDESNLRPVTTVADLQCLIDSSTKSSVRLPDTSWARSPLVVVVRGVLQTLLNIYLSVVVDLEVRGRELLNDLSLPAIFVANHTSHLDSPVILQSLLPSIRRRTAVAAAADYFFGMDGGQAGQRGLPRRVLPVFAPLLLNALPFSRRKSIRKSLELLGEVLDEGWSVIMYPEGTRSITGEMSSFKPGIGLIAAEMCVSVVPVKLAGLYGILPKGRAIPRRGKAKIIFGKPLFFKGENDYASIAREIEDSLSAL